MALINSVGVGNGSKSVGEFTYRSVRGRTIASKRVLKNSSNSAAQGNQRSLFAAQSKFLTLYDCYVFNAFTKTRFGSRRNRAASDIKALAPYVRNMYEVLTANGTPLNLAWNWFARAMSSAQMAIDENAADSAAIRNTRLLSSNSGVSIAAIDLRFVTDTAGAIVSFAIDKCGAELLEIIRAKKPAWASLSDAAALQRAFSVSAYAVTPRGRGVSLGEIMSADMPSADAITPIGSYITPNFQLLTYTQLTPEDIEHFGLEGVASQKERLYVFNILKFLGEPVNLTFDVAYSTVPDTDYAILPFEP